MYLRAQVQRWTANREKQCLWRAWRLLCPHTTHGGPATAAAEASIVAAAASATAASDCNTVDDDPLPRSDPVSRMDATGNNGSHRERQLRKMVSKRTKRLLSCGVDELCLECSSKVKLKPIRPPVFADDVTQGVAITGIEQSPTLGVKITVMYATEPIHLHRVKRADGTEHIYLSSQLASVSLLRI